MTPLRAPPRPGSPAPSSASDQGAYAVRTPALRQDWPDLLAPGTLQGAPLLVGEIGRGGRSFYAAARQPVPPFGAPRGRAFGATRDGTPARLSAGVDLAAKAGWIVASPVGGHVLRRSPWWRGTDVTYIRDRRIVVALGGMVHDAPGCVVGSSVRLGQRLGHVTTPDGSRPLLHVEVYDAADDTDAEFIARVVAGELRWYVEGPTPPRLLDPTYDLLVLMREGAR